MLNEQEAKQLETLEALKAQEGDRFHPSAEAELQALRSKAEEPADAESEPKEEIGEAPEGTGQESQIESEPETSQGEVEGGDQNVSEETNGEQIGTEENSGAEGQENSDATEEGNANEANDAEGQNA